MHNSFTGWESVAKRLRRYAAHQQALEDVHGSRGSRLNSGQQASLTALAKRLPHNGVVIADEVGMGKTRIAVETARAVIESGGRVAVLVPPGLGFQWRDELRDGGVDSPPILRSLGNYFDPWKQDETPSKLQPWFSISAVVISHAFTNWRLGDKPAYWRWGLLPAIYARWQKRTQKKAVPWGYRAHEGKQEPYVNSAAESIYEAIPKDSTGTAYRLCREMFETTPWPAALDRSEYGRNSELRPGLERAVGLGLGVFDLVIVDEAHKSRGDDSGLSRLLDSVIQCSPSVRILAMTATPVELDVSQWQKTLNRIGVDIKRQPSINNAITAYATAVKRVRVSPSSSDARRTYAEASRAFHKELSPFLLRRDKREDKAVMAFANYSGLAANNYRKEEEIRVETALLTPAWRQAVCAAEALSVVTRQGEMGQAKRLRLTMGNGHGIAALLNNGVSNDESDLMQQTFDATLQAEDANDEEGAKDSESDDTANAPPETYTDPKRAQRGQWWLAAMAQAFNDGSDCLFEHPALLACVKAIEAATESGEKVLVFGRFTQPLRALVDLLNAREMLRCLQNGRPWPQAKIHDAGLTGSDQGERPAVLAALRQLNFALSLTEIDAALGRQYKDLENFRERWRVGLVEHIAEGLDMTCEPAAVSQMSKVQQLFSEFRKSTNASSDGIPDGHNALTLVSKALLELMGDSDDVTPADFAAAFEQLVNALTDRDEGEQDGDGVKAAELWSELEGRLNEEYNRPQGGFARLMIGGTTPSARRMLQLAFNRLHSFPKVLVAQSMVGREGLNLHRACSTVILLHPEWNPGIVEQQIGRVDRVGSHWSKQLEQAIVNKVTLDQLPRIKICPVIFEGTYDEHHWTVLRERWDDLRAQLHGVVIPLRLFTNDQELRCLAEEIEAVAPNFSPTPRDGGSGLN